MSINKTSEEKETIKDYEMALDETEQPIDLAELDEMEDVSDVGYYGDYKIS